MKENRFSQNKCDYFLSYRKIEGLEHMASLQILNLASNSIEQVPFWLAKKLRSLQTLNLQNNKIFSLHELSRLKLLKNLTELMLADNPVSDLAHYRLFLIFHLRSLLLLFKLLFFCICTEQYRCSR
uniref:Uncharacterized protein n=1 Tax=Pygocentrus nattereri TaxID=42514 RepID=A0AAR2LNS8_PYGNA